MPVKATLTLIGMLGVPATTQQVTVAGITQEPLTITGTRPADGLQITTALPLEPLKG